ncbi:MAG: FKBP-type peptidyl-prolyl cis-trans isomerase [Myxococcota bacterium]
MSSASEVATEKVVVFNYTLKNEGGEVLDTSEGRDPLPYLHGAGNIVPGLERQMEGKAPGDSFEAVVPPSEGYGERQEPGPQAVPRSAFPEDVEVQAGMQFAAQDAEGEMVPIWVLGVQDDQVIVDNNHPLAGETLHFAIEIVDVRDATDDEKEHGHPHGADGTDEH